MLVRGRLCVWSCAVYCDVYCSICIHGYLHGDVLCSCAYVAVSFFIGTPIVLCRLWGSIDLLNKVLPFMVIGLPSVPYRVRVPMVSCRSGAVVRAVFSVRGCTCLFLLV